MGNLLPGDPRLASGHHHHHGHGHDHGHGDHGHQHHGDMDQHHMDHNHDHNMKHDHDHGNMDHNTDHNHAMSNSHEHNMDHEHTHEHIDHNMENNMDHPHDMDHNMEHNTDQSQEDIILQLTLPRRPNNNNKNNNRRNKNRMKNKKNKKNKNKESRRPKKIGDNSGSRNKPFLFRIPRTNFGCTDRAPGYYADMEADCQVYHMCTERGGRRAFLCPEGTRFNQRTLVCDHENRVSCHQASDFYHKNIVLHQEALAATARARRKHAGQPRRKSPRLQTPSEIIRVRPRPNFVRGNINGRVAFAPLFKQQVNKLDINKFTTTKSTTTTTITTTTTTTTTSTRTNDRDDKFVNLLLGLPELPEPREESRNSDASVEDRLQLLPPKEASDSVARFHKDPEEKASGPNPPSSPASFLQPPPAELSPVQFVGQVMTPRQLKSLPQSPIFHIKPATRKTIASITRKEQPRSSGANRALGIFGQKTARKHHDDNDEVENVDESEISLPVQLKSPGPGLPAPLVWISPASLARSPMVSLRTLDNDIDEPLEHALTMNFPARRRKIFQPGCVECLNKTRQFAKCSSKCAFRF